jgi:hypothetical protein
VNQHALDAIQQVLFQQEQTEINSVRFLRLMRTALVDTMCEYYENDKFLDQNNVVKRRSSWLNPLKRGNTDDDTGVAKVVSEMVMQVQAFRTRLEAIEGDLTEESVERCVEASVPYLFKQLDVKSKGRVTHEDLSVCLANAPFDYAIPVKQSLNLLRSFGLHSGFDQSELANIMGLSFQELMSNVERVKLDSCFGAKMELKCNICDKPVGLKHLETHAAKCAPDAHAIDASATSNWGDLNKSGNLSNSGKNSPRKKRINNGAIVPDGTSPQGDELSTKRSWSKGSHGGATPPPPMNSSTKNAAPVSANSKVLHVDTSVAGPFNCVDDGVGLDSIVIQGSTATYQQGLVASDGAGEGQAQQHDDRHVLVNKPKDSHDVSNDNEDDDDDDDDDDDGAGNDTDSDEAIMRDQASEIHGSNKLTDPTSSICVVDEEQSTTAIEADANEQGKLANDAKGAASDVRDGESE